MSSWIDSHNHLQDSRLGETEAIVAAMKRVGITRCVVNATREADWQAVEELAQAHPGFVSPAFGIHPWHAATATDGWQERLSMLLEKHPHASIGECGLDRWVSEPSLEMQKTVFLDQLQLAQTLDRPVTIHSLKAWDALFECLDEVTPRRFLLHSFGGSIEIARRLVSLGAFFSFSGYFLQPRKAAVVEVFKQLPPDRILLETDAPDMLPPEDIITHALDSAGNHPANLPAIGQALASALQMSAAELATLTAANARKCFGL
ncbi:MAG: TatD family hydrolase [Verrucomicrobiota bacterium]